MPKKTPDLSSKRFGKLTAIARAPSNKGGFAMWVCRCDCGGEKITRAVSLINGLVSSCGCFHPNRTHGMSSTAMYRIWHGMKSRCQPTWTEHQHYFDRGISVCERWKDFLAFYADMGDRPTARHSLDRVDVNKGYEPGNVRWALPSEQSINRRSSVNLSIMINGVMTHANVIAARYGLGVTTVRWRIRQGWPVEKVIGKSKLLRKSPEVVQTRLEYVNSYLTGQLGLGA